MLVGGIYFNEFESLDSLSSVMFPIGMAITVVGKARVRVTVSFVGNDLTKSALFQ